MPDAGEVKAKVIIEYDGSGLEQAKKDLASLAESAGSAGESAQGASDGLANLDQQMGKNAESAKSFGAAIDELPKMVESGGTAVSEMTSALDEHQAAIEEIGSAYEDLQKSVGETTENFQKAAPSMQMVNEHAQSMNESLSQAQQSFSDMNATLAEPGATEAYSRLFQSVAGESFAGSPLGNLQAFQAALASPDSFQMIDAHLDKTGQSYGQFANSLSEGNQQILHEMSTDWAQTNSLMDEAGKSFVDAGKSAHEGFGSIAVSAGEADAAVADFLGTGEKAGKAAGGGDWWSGQSETLFGGGGLMGILNDVAMPLMALQMIGAAVGAVGQGIYDAAAIAEGPAAHSFGTFTGAIDTMNASIQKSGQNFSEQFGQGTLPALDAMNNANQRGGGIDSGWLGKGLGMETGIVGDILSIAGGGILGGAAKILTLNPGNTFGDNLWQGGVQGLQNYWAGFTGAPEPFPGPPIPTANPMQQQIDQMNALAHNPEYLASQASYSSAMAKAQQAQVSWDTSHYGGTTGPTDPMNEILQSQLVRANGGTYGTLHDPLSQWLASFPTAEDVGMGGGCFVASTPVLMADGTSKAIEDIQIDDLVFAYDGEQVVPAPVLALIKPHPKQVYTLTFSDDHSLTLTDSHPISTLAGWKSISPEATAIENPELLVTPLTIGDIIQTVNGTCILTSILPLHGTRQIYNIEVDEPHTFYANGVLAHNKRLSSGGMTNGGVGSEQVSLSHTFTATVTWEANNLAKQFTGVASWAAQGLSNTFQGIANWVGQGLSNTFNGIANWVGQGLSNTFQGIANWVGQGLQNTFQGIANWVGEGLQNTFQGVASWVGQGLNNTFKGIASWIGSGLEHTFNAVANWTAQNLTPNFTVNPSFTMLAEGTSNWGGGPAIVGEAGPEVVESNGQYSMFNQGASLVDLPSGSNVYPMKNLGSSGVTQFADGTGNYMLPITLGMGGGNIVVNLTSRIELDSRVLAEQTIPHFAPLDRVATGNRSY
jgi:hypothetical protein